MSKITLFLTGCVNPNTFVDTNKEMLDPIKRKKEYISTIKWYLTHTDHPIIFTENSGTDISESFTEKEKKRMEFIVYNSTPSKEDRGKGYKEMEIIKYTIEQSKLLKSTDYIIKITGRLKLLNIKSYSKILPNIIPDNFCMAKLLRKKNWGCDSRFIFCTLSFLNYLTSFAEELSNRILFEHILEKAIYTFPGNLTFIYPPCLYRISGLSGTYGNSYEMKVHAFYIKNVVYKITSLAMPYCLNKVQKEYNPTKKLI